MSPQTALPTFRIDPGTALAQAQLPSTRPVSLQSPAIEVITDLAQVKAATVAPGTSLPQAEQTMILQGVRMLFVVSDLPAFEGLITHTDLHGARQMSVVNERRVRWDALCVADVMTRTPRTIGPEQLAVDCVEIMEAAPKVSQLLVVDATGVLVGALHLHDLFRARIV